MDESREEEVEPENEFQFETDHLALRGNKDYCDLLRYIVSLETQRVKALKDIEEIVEAQNKALEDPLEFVQNLQNGTLKFPDRQHISDLPKIDWSKYGIQNISQETEIKSPVKDSDEPLVRGRLFNDSKPESFNQLWSCEEQRRLEELLEIYPEEAVEARRYKKIADALGTRTPIQVMSRIQKYFAKLAKAGLPIPGRVPRKISKDRNRLTNVFYKKSTFFPQLHVPVKMEDPSETGEVYDKGDAVLEPSNRSVLELLKAAKEQRLLDEQRPIWQDSLCVGCQKTGYLGARWTDDAGTDYCTDCVVQLQPTEKLTPVRSTV